MVNKVIIVAVVAACLSVVYYFAIALPGQNDARLALEKQRIEQSRLEKQEQQIVKEKAEQEVKDKEMVRVADLNLCRQEVERKASAFFKLNSIQTQPGALTASWEIFDRKDKMIERGYADCERMYGTFK